MQIVGRSEDYTSTDPALNPPIVEGQKNPMRRDTVQVPSMHSITLRVIADNPGAWLFHCTSLPSHWVKKVAHVLLTLLMLMQTGHIEWHLQAGLAVTFIEAPLQLQERAKSTFPQFIADQCTSQGIPISGNAAGHQDPFDLTGLPSGPYPQNNGWHGKGIGAMFGYVPLFSMFWCFPFDTREAD